MNSNKKMLAAMLGAVCSVALIGGSSFAFENHRRVDNTTGPIEYTKAIEGEGKTYSSEELAKQMGITLKEFEGQIKTYELPISEAIKVTEEVNKGVQIPITSTIGEGESYTEEELVKKLGITLEELKSRIKTHTYDLTNAKKGVPIKGHVNTDEKP